MLCVVSVVISETMSSYPSSYYWPGYYYGPRQRLLSQGSEQQQYWTGGVLLSDAEILTVNVAGNQRERNILSSYMNTDMGIRYSKQSIMLSNLHTPVSSPTAAINQWISTCQN